jgi:hypothetical protein
LLQLVPRVSKCNCCTCLEEEEEAKGVFCLSDSHHFTCDDCLSTWLRHCCSGEQAHTLKRNSGLIYCPSPECVANHPNEKMAFTASQLAQHCSNYELWHKEQVSYATYIHVPYKT